MLVNGFWSAGNRVPTASLTAVNDSFTTVFRVNIAVLQWWRESLPLQHVLPAAASLRSVRSRLLRGSVSACVERLRSSVCACVERLRWYTQRRERWDSRREHEQPPHSARAPAARPTAHINNKTDKNTNLANKKLALCASVIRVYGK